MRARDDVAAIAAHQTKLVEGDGLKDKLILGIGVAKARGRVDEVKVAEMRRRRDKGKEGRSNGWILHGRRRRGLEKV